MLIIIYKSYISSKSSNENNENDIQIIKKKSEFDILIDYSLLNIDYIIDRDKFIIGIYQDLLIVGSIFFYITSYKHLGIDNY